MLNFLKKIFGDKSVKDLKELRPIVDKIKAVEPGIAKLSANELRAKTQEFRAIIAKSSEAENKEIAELKVKIDATTDFAAKEQFYERVDELEKLAYDKNEAALEEILPEAYAVVRHTARLFNENKEITVRASEMDEQLAARYPHVSINGEDAIFQNSWDAAGTPVTWNMEHYDVQLIGGYVLHSGKIAEMATGEGKTLVATLPVYLNALTGKGVHLVTVNDYLAKRDSEWMGPLYQFHGLTVDCIDRHKPNSEERRQAYLADITFGTNNEFGFDYLRDNMSRNPEDLVQRGHNYAIVDEVDSVLVDDARTPLIISGPTPNGDKDRESFNILKPYVVKLMQAQRTVVQGELSKAKKLIAEKDGAEGGKHLLRAYRGLPKNKALIKFLSEDGVRALLQKTESLFMQEQSKNMHIIDDELYFTIDEKQNQVDLSEQGIELISNDTEPDFFVLPDIGSEIAVLEKSELDQEEKAVKKTEMMTNFGLKSERVHTMNQLLKAYSLFEKDTEYVLMENKVMIVDEQTGRIMDGRRFSDGLHQAIEAKENVKIEASTQTYATVTLQNYFRMYSKLSGMTGTAETEAGELWEIYKLDVVVIPTNRPITRDDVQDQVYKTKREKYNAVIAEVVRLREQGRSILVGTTSVEISELLSRALKIQKVPHQVLNAKLHQKEADVVAEAGRPGTVTIATNMAGRGTDIKLSDEVKAAGGLAIVGTERHDSRRVDRQLRGRAGRQGDVGSSQFYVSLEDNLMRLFGSERIAGIMDKMGLEEGEMIQHGMVSKSIERAQRKVEENNFGVRKRLLEYDDVMNSQREVIYKRRRHALFGERLSVDISNMIYDTCGSIVSEFQPSKDYQGFKLELYRVLALDSEINEDDFNQKNEDEVTDFVYNKAIEAYQLKTERIAKVAFPVIKNVYSNKNNNFQNIVVPFTDGVKSMQVATNLKDAYDSEGKTLTKDFEKGIVLAIIDDSWKEHLREMDELRQNVQGAQYEQKDPLLIYKFESFKLFQNMLDATNKEIVSFLMKGDLPHPDPSQMRQAPVKQKTDLSGLQTSRSDAQEIAQGGGGQGQPNQPQRPPKPKQVIKTEKQYGRNERVKIQNLTTGEEKEVKYKQAEPLLADNQWTVVE